MPKQTILDDTSIVAFLKLKNHTVIPCVSMEDPNKVSFTISGDPKQIEMDIQSFYGNEMVGIFDFIKCLKEVKSALYNIKRIGRGNV